MEPWIIWAIASALTGWIYNFAYKIISEEWYNTHLAVLYSYTASTILAGLYCLYTGSFYISYEILLITFIFAFIHTSFFYISIVARVEAMKNIDTVIFYPLYKTFWPIFVTCISLFFFWEYLSSRDFLWIVLGICVPLLLITKTENKIQRNLLLWVILVIITSVVASASSTATKMVYIKEGSPELFLFLCPLLWMIFSYLVYHLHSKKTGKVYKTKWLPKFALMVWVIHIFAFYTFIRAFEWNTAIAFTINSFSILVPITLSIIFYGEHFSMKKWCVIALSIVSILLFL